MRILVLDDSATIRQLAKFTLQTQADWHIDIADTVESSIQLCKSSEHYDLFIVDYMLNHETGFDFLKRVRRKPSCANTPAIMLSGEDRKEFKQEIKDLNISAWMQKPFEPLKLIETVKKFSPND